MATWHTLESAREYWLDADLDDDVLQELLDIAQEQVIAYAPKVYDSEGAVVDLTAEEADVPTNYRYGQLEQAKNLWNAGRVDASGGVGEGDFVMRPHPLDWIIKQILRPRRAVPRVR